MVLQYCWQQGVGQQFVYRHIQCLRQSGERIIGWREHRERTFCAQRVNQTGCTYGCFEQRMVFAFDDDVHNRGFFFEFGHQYSIDDVHHAVIGGKVRDNDLSVVYEDAVRSDTHRYVFSE